MSHTPLPFRLVQGESSWEVWSPKDDAPGSMNNFVVADGIQDSEDAAFIVKACNAHEELLAAYQINDDGTFSRVPSLEDKLQGSQEAQAKALGWMLDKALPTKPVETQAAINSGLRDIEAMFMARNKEACVMEQGIVEALTWLDDHAAGKAHSVLTEVLAKLSAMRVKEGQ